ncbi:MULTISPECIES: Dyp-type peroxidase [Mycobacteriaceae]|uniref:Dyp-type peroxidase n=1 Tax=Mycolicibacterium parafortuitum TaxID=39692 RepID=A0ACC6MJX9_MYCPF|nr:MULTISPECIES: Dyp-type peroxidase [Mycobacteriaceae]MDZ5086916.1 Dyp-type peroxidase [Mycolicibacterium parafortuitum]GFM16012.1 Dyp-type peroxidase [Mycobacterium sp. PO1]GFM23706.1 Dyp-type peroxidase [Mycobacterium sp. PO2]
MVRPQPVLTPLSPAAIFLVATINDSPSAPGRVRDALAELSGLVRAVGFRVPDAQLRLIAGIGSAAWDRLFCGPRPARLHEFVELTGARHHAPSTPGDLLFHIKGGSLDVCFELGGRVLAAMGGAVTVVDEVHGFKFFEQRDLLGFVDGTENPNGPDAVDAVQIGAEDPEFSGASYVHVQRYRHDMDAWNSLSVTEQELVIGRTKLEDIELDDAVKPTNSHVALNSIEDEDGNELQVVRANMPFGSLGDGESGTYYIAYAADPAVTERMLVNMFIGDPPGNTDRILDFSTAETGSLFFVPTIDFLDDPPELPAESAELAPSPTPPAYPGSLAIGSLKGQPQ